MHLLGQAGAMQLRSPRQQQLGNGVVLGQYALIKRANQRGDLRLTRIE